MGCWRIPCLRSPGARLHSLFRVAGRRRQMFSHPSEPRCRPNDLDRGAGVARTHACRRQCPGERPRRNRGRSGCRCCRKAERPARRPRLPRLAGRLRTRHRGTSDSDRERLRGARAGGAARPLLAGSGRGALARRGSWSGGDRPDCRDPQPRPHSRAEVRRQAPRRRARREHRRRRPAARVTDRDMAAAHGGGASPAASSARCGDTGLRRRCGVMEQLDERARDLVAAAWTALETALAPLSATDFPALRDPALRGQLERLAARAGRVLVEHPDGWLTGYDDDVVQTLGERGLAVLAPDDRAQFALGLFSTVCLPRARTGTAAGGWDAPGVSTEELLRYRPQYRSVMRAALRRLGAAGLIERSPGGGIVPGPALRRLTAAQSQRLW